MASKTNSLVTIKPAQMAEVFIDKGLDPFIEEIRKKIADFEPDLTTAKSRAKIASLARKISSSKVFIDEAGAEFVSGIKAQAKIIDAERKRFRDIMDILRDEARKPLTDWQNAEKKRIADIQLEIQEIRDYKSFIPDLDNFTDDELLELHGAIKKLENISIDDSFQEFKIEATESQVAILKELQMTHKLITEKRELEAEKARLAAEEKERKRKCEEKRIADEAAEKATLKAESKAQAKHDEAIKRQGQAEARAQQLEKQRIVGIKERLKEIRSFDKEYKKSAEVEVSIDILKTICPESCEEFRQEGAEEKKRIMKILEARFLQLNKKEEREAAEEAEDARQEAIKIEQERAASEKAAREKIDRDRAADRKHRKKIQDEARQALMNLDFTEQEAQKIILHISLNNIPNITIKY